jgi:hypothetical protein
MDSRIHYYREKAEEVRRLAETAVHPDIRAEFLNIAAQYDRMAARLDYQETHREIRVPAEPLAAKGSAKPDSGADSGHEDAR